MVKFNKPVADKPEEKTEKTLDTNQLVQLDKVHESGYLVSKEKDVEKLKIPGLGDGFGKNLMKELKDYKPDPPVPTYAIEWLIHSVRSQYKGRNKRPKYCPKCKKAKIEVNFDENKATCKTCGNVFIAGSCAGFTLIGEVSRWMKEYGKNHPPV